jgi:hypothetical protein
MLLVIMTRNIKCPKCSRTSHATNSFETALNLNAKEGAEICIHQHKGELEQFVSIHNRSVSLFEPRPSWDMAPIRWPLSPEEIYQGIILDRGHSLQLRLYNDPDGTILTNVMKPIGLVCGGINLEYYFSRVDNIKWVRGTKLPHNVMGLLV